MMATYLLTIALIFTIMLAGIAVERLYRGFAARNPQLGPFRDTSKCGCCSAGSGCSDSSCEAEPAATHSRYLFPETLPCRPPNLLLLRPPEHTARC